MNDFVLAKVCSSRIEADVIKGILELEGIQVYIKANDAEGVMPYLAFSEGVEIFVPQEDLARAREMMETTS